MAQILQICLDTWDTAVDLLDSFLCSISDLTYLRAFLEAIPVDSKFRVDEPIFFRSTARQRGIEHGNSKEYTTSKDPDSAVIAAIQTKMGFSTDQ